jgi:hypothetical protein
LIGSNYLSTKRKLMEKQKPPGIILVGPKGSIRKEYEEALSDGGRFKIICRHTKEEPYETLDPEILVGADYTIVGIVLLLHQRGVFPLRVADPWRAHFSKQKIVAVSKKNLAAIGWITHFKPGNLAEISKLLHGSLWPATTY